MKALPTKPRGSLVGSLYISSWQIHCAGRRSRGTHTEGAGQEYTHSLMYMTEQQRGITGPSVARRCMISDVVKMRATASTLRKPLATRMAGETNIVLPS